MLRQTTTDITCEECSISFDKTPLTSGVNLLDLFVFCSGSHWKHRCSFLMMKDEDPR
ncbi:uncharacterized protein PHALS_09870 [Plasmopara halstedii]|uniref:Uncharacterized protein n=1 Tax=Plasmopara halstedii TaxID=4781 RepID=A0A0P1AFX2_PLAHL|nr:uncharacterized protein PHALS_09870 [Plasmopara halstedii]CEG39632.1 hypothetical protein PHALS_09870 [Plasmopara halstedii]|eukprot:XP_024576001.1 hypothetical protein PHALS_09870 [Plasmopara halstedii]